MRESKAELTDRLRRAGRWDGFVKRREELKAAGLPAKDAWRQAAAELPAAPDDAHALEPAEPLIPWAKARRFVNAAETDLDWILRALPVDVPPRVAGRRLANYAVVMALRNSPELRDKLACILLRRMRERAERGHKG